MQPAFPSPQFERAFVLGQVVASEESRTVEFKEVKASSVVKIIANLADEYAVAFLNSEGGSIFWGIRDEDRVVVGVHLSSQQRDELRRVVTDKLNSIQPPLDPTRFRIELHPVSGEAVAPDTFVVELSVPASGSTSPYFTAGNQAYVRLDAANKKLNGQQLIDWIKNRFAAPSSTGSIKEQRLSDLVGRVRRIFAAHGLEYGHLPRFLQLRRAPFDIALADLRNDGSLLDWLNEHKIAWLADTFQIRRAWIDGEDGRVHEEHFFDKQPKLFLSTVSCHLETTNWEDTGAMPEAYFIRWGGGWRWRVKGDFDVMFVLAVPLARLSSERIIFRYVCDFTPYPWSYLRTHIQLRAWAELLLADKNVVTHAWEVSRALGESLEYNGRFWKDVLDDPKQVSRAHWSLDDWTFRQEAEDHTPARDVSFQINDFLRRHGLR